MLLTKEDFKQAIEADLDKYPVAAAHFKAGDSLVIQAIYSIATMVSMLSQQIELDRDEVFEKARDTTVLADAALKGILPRAIPTTVLIKLANNNSAPVVISAGRVLLDSSSRQYEVIDTVQVAANAEVSIRAVQQTTTTISHTVGESKAFYRIEIPERDADKYISGINIEDSNGDAFDYSYQFTNISPNDRVYHMGSDEYQRLYAVFGYENVVGYQPSSGEVLTLYIDETHGYIEPKLNSPFVFEYTQSPVESRIQMSLQEIAVKGQNPPTIDELRELISYPSTYNDDAVYMGEFDRLVNEHLPDFDFISVWNEQVEEEMRGADLDNMNSLFIASSPNNAETQQKIKQVIHRADNSYKLKFLDPVHKLLFVNVVGKIARVYQAAEVGNQIKSLLVKNFGMLTPSSKKGLSIPTEEKLRSVLKDGVQALQHPQSDFTLTLNYEQPIMPEHWHYIDFSSVQVDLQESNVSLKRWGR